MSADDNTISNVDLGFAEKCADASRFAPSNYPSKLGGKPSWMPGKSLPSLQQLQCNACKQCMVFLCQLYIPSVENDENDNDSFHKMIFLFCCHTGACYKDANWSAKAFRFQSIDLESCDVEGRDMERKLCNLCGCGGEKQCAACGVYYCSRDHQVMDWKFSHKLQCNKLDVEPRESTVVHNGFIFNEFDIVIEAEPSEEERRLVAQLDAKKYEKYIHKNDYQAIADKQLDKDLKKFRNTTSDSQFMKFKERICCEPSQIIRYDLGGEPLWVSGECIPSESDIPPCSCGAKRRLEFQVLPQMINYLGVETDRDSLDWGTLVVFTCSDNCMPSDNGCVEEFVWKQDFSQHDALS